jgi:hypothetical protein
MPTDDGSRCLIITAINGKAAPIVKTASITRLEYNRARLRNKPIFGCVGFSAIQPEIHHGFVHTRYQIVGRSFQAWA